MKSWKPKTPKAYQPYKTPKFTDPFKMPKAPKEEPQPHVITEYERTLIQQLRPVIGNKQLIRFWYEDTVNNLVGWRTIEPHLIGQTKYKHARIWLVGWFLPTTEQIIEGHEEKWGNYILDNVKQLTILSQRYTYTRFGYNANDSRMTTILCATR